VNLATQFQVNITDTTCPPSAGSCGAIHLRWDRGTSGRHLGLTVGTHHRLDNARITAYTWFV